MITTLYKASDLEIFGISTEVRQQTGLSPVTTMFNLVGTDVLNTMTRKWSSGALFTVCPMHLKLSSNPISLDFLLTIRNCLSAW